MFKLSFIEKKKKNIEFYDLYSFFFFLNINNPINTQESYNLFVHKFRSFSFVTNRNFARKNCSYFYLLLKTKLEKCFSYHDFGDTLTNNK